MRDYDDYKLDSGQEDKVSCKCDWCNQDIYQGEEYFVLNNGDCLHVDGECYEDYVFKYFRPEFKMAGEE